MTMQIDAQTLGTMSDLQLERFAAGGDKQAFGALYERYASRVHDFLMRIVRDPDEAADLMQETFVRAMKSLSAERAGGAQLSTFLFTIARNLALTRLDRKKRTVSLSDSDADEERAPYQHTDPERLSNPGEALEARELSELVWRAAEALDPKQYSLLDLHVRQGLGSAEIAQVLGVSKGNAYTMLSRLRDQFESAVAVVVMFQRGRRACAELDTILNANQVTAVSPSARKLIERHTVHCETCQGERRELVSATAVLGAVVIVPLPLLLKNKVAEASWEAVRSSAGGSAGNAGGGTGAGTGGGGDGSSPPAREERSGGGSSQLSDASNVSQRGHRNLRFVALASIATLFLAAVGGVASFGYADRSGEAGVTPLAVVAYDSTNSPSPSPSSTVPSYSDASPTAISALLAATSTPALPAPSPAAVALLSTETATMTSPPSPTAPPVEPTAAAPLAGVEDSCATFWSRQPQSGAGPNVEYASLVVALQNRERARQGVRPMIDSPQLTSVAEDYARFLATTRWWETHSGAALHNGADGRGPLDRMKNAEVIGQYSNEQTIAPIGSTWLAALENIAWTPDRVGAGSWNPCELHSHWSQQHVSNYLGIVDASPHDNEYEGTSCYVMYATKTVACVQDFVVFR